MAEVTETGPSQKTSVTVHVEQTILVAFGFLEKQLFINVKVVMKAQY